MLQDLLDLIAPQRCFDCGTAPGLWCLECQSRLRPGQFRLASGTPVVAVSHADQSMMRAIARWKDSEQRNFSTIFARLMATHVERLLPSTHVDVVTIPSRKRSRRKRGYVPMETVARHIAGHNPKQWRVAFEALLWVRQPREQRGLDDAERQHNLNNSLSVQNCPTRAIVLLDDVLTSGATLAEADRALRAVGCAPTLIVVLAAPRKVVGQELVKSVAKPQ